MVGEEKTSAEGRTHVIIFLLDDTGFAQIGSFGAWSKLRTSTNLLWGDCVTIIFTPRRFVRRRGQL
jgi:hypothetical protein